MRLGLYQTPSPAGDLTAALNAVNAALEAAAQDGVDLLTLPETFLPGYNAVEHGRPEGYPEALAALPALVARHRVGLVIGVAEYAEGAVRNAAYVFRRDGTRLASYHKVQLFGPREQALYQPGDALTTFDFDGKKFGVLICYDVEFPEHTRALASAGVDAILVPTANMQPFVNVNEIAVPARALESALTIVYANYCGSEGDLDYVARSLIAGPNGGALARLGEQPGLAAAELPDATSVTAGVPTSAQLADYRPVAAIRHCGAP